MGNSSSSNGLGKNTTAEEVVQLYNTDLSDKVCIVTGSNQGIGLETARVIASRNAHVILACRNMEAANVAVEHIKSRHESAKVEAMKLDLGSLESVRTFSAEFLARGLPLHLLLNNAGIFAGSREVTVDGFESGVGVNHFGHFLLTNLLLPRIKESAPARIVVVSSMIHTWGVPDMQDINWEHRSFGSMRAYGASKSANILFTNELNRQLQGSNVTVNSLHPGGIATNITHSSGILHFLTQRVLPSFFFKSVEQGASTTVYCAVAPQLEGIGGKYFNDCNEAEVAKACLDENLQREFWTFSEKAVGLLQN